MAVWVETDLSEVSEVRRARLLRFTLLATVLTTLLALTWPAAGQPAFELRRPVEWIIPAGTGGGADQQARFMAPLIEKHKFASQPFIPVNQAAGAGAQAFQVMLDRAGDTHTILITLDNLFATPLNAAASGQPILNKDGTPFSWRNLTPIARLLLDNFILWVHADSPYQSVEDFRRAARLAPPGTLKMAGTGSKQEDEIIMVLLEQSWRVDFTYVPFAGGGAVAAALVGKQVDFTVNNPLEAVGHWEGNRVRPLAIFSALRVPFAQWKGVATMKELKIPIEYQMLRGVFGPPNMPPEAVAYYQRVFRRLMDTAEIGDFVERGAFTRAYLTGPAFVRWLGAKDKSVRDLMVKGGLVPKQ